MAVYLSSFNVIGPEKRMDGTTADSFAAGNDARFGLVSDGDKGDITASGSGTVWTLDLALNQIVIPTGSVNFNDQQATSFRIENRTSDPGAPTVGQIWLRTDL